MSYDYDYDSHTEYVVSYDVVSYDVVSYDVVYYEHDYNALDFAIDVVDAARGISYLYHHSSEVIEAAVIAGFICGCLGLAAGMLA